MKTPATMASAKPVPKSVTRSAAKPSGQPSPSSQTKNPAGGLTAAGRKQFLHSEGAHLKPGVTKPVGEMTLDEMRRKGSWAARFYGRTPLPPLKNAKGEPTRFALSAHAWGEPVPATEAQARKIAEKGRKLLERYHKRKAAAAAR